MSPEQAGWVNKLVWLTNWLGEQTGLVNSVAMLTDSLHVREVLAPVLGRTSPGLLDLTFAVEITEDAR